MSAAFFPVTGLERREMWDTVKREGEVGGCEGGGEKCVEPGESRRRVEPGANARTFKQGFLARTQKHTNTHKQFGQP